MGSSMPRTTLAAFAKPPLGASALLVRPKAPKPPSPQAAADVVPKSGRAKSMGLLGFPRGEAEIDRANTEVEMPEWYPYLKALKENPFRQEFVYLALRDPDALLYRPYDLKVVPHSEVDPDHFYTLSSSGVTHVLNGVTEFIPLERFEREFFLFSKVVQKTVFKKYRVWKGFVCWKNYVRRKKIAHARASLENNLFLLNPIFQSALGDIRSRCVDVGSMLMHQVDAGDTKPLGEMLQAQRERKDECAEALQAFSRENAAVTAEACRDALEAPQARLAEQSAGERTMATTLAGALNDAAKADSADKDKDSYAVVAATRSEKRRLSSFIRLVDFMVQETLRDLLHDSMSDMLTMMATREREASEYDRTKLLYEAAVKAKDVRSSAASKRSMNVASAHSQNPLARTFSRSARRGSLRRIESGRRSNVASARPSSQGSEKGAGDSRRGSARDGHGGAPVLLDPLEELAQMGIDLETLDPASLLQEQTSAPLFFVRVHLDSDDDALSFYPGPPEVLELMESIMAGYLDVMDRVERLLGSERMAPFTSEGVEVAASGAAQPGGHGQHGVANFVEQIKDDIHESNILSIKALLAAAFDRASRFKDTFQALKTRLLGYRAVTQEGMLSEVRAQARDLQTFDDDWAEFENSLAQVKAIQSEAKLGNLLLDLSPMKEAFQPFPESCIKEIRELLPKLAFSFYQEFVDDVHSVQSRLAHTPTSVEEFVDFSEALQDALTRRESFDERNSNVRAYYDMIDKFGIKVDARERAAFQTLSGDFQQFVETVEAAEASKDGYIKQFTGDLDAQEAEMMHESARIRNAAQEEAVLDADNDVDRALSITGRLMEEMTELRDLSKRIAGYRQLFRLPENKYLELEESFMEVELKHLMWKGMKEWDDIVSEWEDALFRDLDTQNLEDTLAKFVKMVNKIERNLPPNRVVEKFQSKVEKYKIVVPVVVALRNKNMKAEHWFKISDALGKQLGPEGPEDETLSQVLALGVMDHQDDMIIISTEATQEAHLLALLNKVSDRWNSVDFDVRPYKESKNDYILGSVEDIMATLEDSMMTMMTITSSRFVAGIREQVDSMEAKLRVFSETLDQWLEVQKTWMYLEPIFQSQDIRNQLQAESRKFQQVDSQFKDIMKHTNTNPTALVTGITPGWLEKLTKCNEMLEEIEKNLEVYLDVKKRAFPRFYFLSNNDLLEILSQGKVPTAVQPHLQKCFDGIASLVFADQKQNPDILAMVSGEGEEVGLGSTLKARGQVEEWLGAVEKDMKSTMRRLGKQAWQDYAQTPRKEWVMQHAAQLVLSVSNVFWCQDVEECLVGTSNPAERMEEFYGKNVSQLSELTGLVRGDLSKLQRKIIVALITVDVHNRDIVEELYQARVDSVNEFRWQMQLRYYFDKEEGDMVIRQVNAEFNYGCEYLGAQPRLVVTPMTDRCYMTLTGALNLTLGGAPQGPAGTGKTETTKDLAKCLGIQCVVFNCGDNITHRFMETFFCGLSMCGAWACFDEFNRIDIEVLSVVAQQLLQIQNALKIAVEKFIFCGREISLVPTCGVFITMNPGYAGRTELPDNLKALFRPMAMMIPDYALVAEVMLFSEGFDSAKTLSRKMVKLYKLSSEQLSQQKHYDFGMRALKSVLVLAGALKRASPNLDEDIVLVRAMRDSNIPKFLEDDARLFNSIVSDLFPGREVPEDDYGELETSLRAVSERARLQTKASFILKAVQLFMTFSVRFGVMLVGPTGSGKSRVYQMLRDAMTKLRKDGSRDAEMQRVHTFPMNPKAISKNEVYGYVEELTGEWREGLGATLIRDAKNDTKPDRKWVVFDGPVDAVWIEDMNTVLDDNCMLCLANGQRIKLDPVRMRMLFEVEDLEQASPATVSRCGIVYVPSDCAGWEPMSRTWLTKLGELTSNEDTFVSVKPETEEMLWQMLTKHVQPGLDFVRSKCKEPIPSADVNLVASMCSWIQALAGAGKGLDLSKDISEIRLQVKNIFGYAYVWGIGGNIDSENWDAFDTFVREQFEGDVMWPPRGTVYDYFVDPKRDFGMRAWSEIVPQFQFKHNVPYFKLLVPTLDTTRCSALLATALKIQKPVLLTGASGIGKSAVVMNALFGEEPSAPNMLPIVLNFSAQTNSMATQDSIESKMEKMGKRLVPPSGKRICLFVDDVNMPLPEKWGAQPPIELLRQLLDMGGFYDRKKLFWKELVDITTVAACAPPGGGRNVVTPRFYRHFSMIHMPPPSEEVMQTIFQKIVGGFMDHFFPADMRPMADAMVKSTVEIFLRISAELLPTPTKNIYVFNLRDVSKVFQGILLIRPGQCSDKETMTRLWVHENQRVFGDRLVDNEDRQWFQDLVYSMLKSKFHVQETQDDFFVERDIIFADFLKMGLPVEEREYEEVSGSHDMQKIFKSYLEEYNDMGIQPMHLVFFADAIRHISRISRVLRQPRGNAMLVGVGGSGKQSLTRFAAFIAEYQTFQIEISRGYGSNEFREDLKSLYKIAGIDGFPVVFLFTDNQIVNESFVEDINNLLNSGEVPGMYPADEKEAVLTDMREYCIENNLPLTRDAIWTTFIDRVRDNLHVVLCMSPVGDAFRSRCRQFPSLVNCCTIDWFSEWPEEALRSVSTRFLSEMELEDKSMNEALAELCVIIHQSVVEESANFYEEMRRRFYTTPKSYLDLINLYLTLYEEKTQELDRAADRLRKGLAKLDETNVKVAEMQVVITELQPVLKDRSKAAEVLIEQVTREQADAKVIEEVVAKEEAEVKTAASKAQAVKDNADEQVSAALPALKEAEVAVNSLSKSDISEVKAFKTPPPLVELTLQGVLILLREKKTDWDAAKKVLSDSNFVKKLFEYDKENIPDEVLARLVPIIENESFLPATVAKQSNAAKSLCMWVRAMDKFAKVLKVVTPLREQQQAAEATLNELNSKLAEKQASLKEIKDRVKGLEEKLEATQLELNTLSANLKQSQARLQRATKLTDALGDEAVRWQQEAEKIETDMIKLVGDVFLGSAAISYVGAFTGPYRDKLTRKWVEKCKELKIPVSDNFSLSETLSNPMELREWAQQGLPSDSLSIDNGILATRGKRWPLMIDPQGQAHRWIRQMETRFSLRAVKQTDPNLSRHIEAAVRNGHPILIEDVGEMLEPVLEPILNKAITTDATGRQMYIKLGGASEGEEGTPYNPDFKLYLTTKMSNPHYLPEVCIKVTLINFTVTLRGLEDQLLTHVVRIENKDLEDNLTKLVVSISNDKRQLKGLEDQILKLLNDAGEVTELLDDDNAIKMLNNSKLTSGVINSRVEAAEVSEKEINGKREMYRPAAKRGSIIYFVIADLANVDPMYQYSLQYFIELYKDCVKKAEQADDIAQRLDNIMAYMTLFMFRTVCRGLFEAHKAIYAFLICTSIKRNGFKPEDIEIPPEEWDFLMRGTVAPADAKAPPNPAPETITDAQWDGVRTLDSTLERFQGIADSVKRNPGEWAAFAQCPDPMLEAMPMDWGTDIVDNFMRLICIKVFREEALASSFTYYVGQELGNDFVESPPFSLADVYTETRKEVPVVFVLTTGADPTAMLQRFGETMNRSTKDEKLRIISLGSGQGPHAENVIETAKRNGDWVCLQNCHLAKSWMPALEKKVEELQEKSSGVHNDFRLWLTSMPAEHFPVPVLQSSIKITVEPPKGLKANLLRTYNDFAPDFLESVEAKPKEWRKLVFACSFFHGVVQERRKYGALGWNIRYEFSQGDLDCSLMTLRNMLEEQDHIPWEALLYVTGDINYGGRVTDDNDRVLLKHVLRKYYDSSVLSDQHEFTPDGLYHMPTDGDKDRYVEYIKQLPVEEGPEVFGMHGNANITFQLNETRKFIDTILSMQPRVSGAKGNKTPADTVIDLCKEIDAKLPPLPDVEKAPTNPEVNPFSQLESGHDNSLGIVLRQETERFVKLFGTIQRSLVDLQKAIQGLVVMSAPLEDMFGSLLNNQVPGMWEEKAYPSLKPLASWVTDFIARIHMINEWIQKGEPVSFWIPGLFFPQGFMTAVLQNHARKTQIAIDRLNFGFEVMQVWEKEQVEAKPADGVYIHGLFLDSARWDPVDGCLRQSNAREMHSPLPVVHLIPVVDYEPNPEDYQCPLYKTSVRAGTLNTTGQSTNFVLHMGLKMPESQRDSSFWTLQSVAALCCLDD